jgi:multidrug efflux pump subunit AcrA (membrane-fusion protein)
MQSRGASTTRRSDLDGQVPKLGDGAKEALQNMSQRIGRIALLFATLLAVASVVPLTSCTTGGQQGQEATPTPIPTPIIPTKPTYVVARGEVVKKIDFTGRVAPVIEQELFFRASGYVDVVYFKRNAVVDEGELLAEL